MADSLPPEVTGRRENGGAARCGRMTAVPAWSRRTPFALVVLLSLWMLFSPGSTVPAGPPYSDKVVHALLFAALALTGLRAGLRLPLLLVGLTAYAGASEVLQSVLPIHRDGDVADAAVDLLGVAIGTVAGRRLR
jgi:VanZ family protein